MRILVVSAHFPPNFVSGGTLVPFRSALELARRGHDVKVFAGWLGSTRAAGEAFGHGEEGPVPVRWFPVDDAIDWTSRRNFDNPGAAAEFAAVLREFEPEVVHFHSMQGLGAGLLLEAARRGTPFVVTAHDFWWWCARQFLCDRDYHPCCPVVVAGVCPCSVDRPWLDERTTFTTRALRRAARVIAVSPIAARVFLANGLPPEQLVVLDNPVDIVEGPRPPQAPPSPSETGGEGASPARADAFETLSARRTAAARDVRFVFAGGQDPMKGLPVLRKALGLLAGVPGWSADLYGVDDVSLSSAGDELGDAARNVRAHPAFAPGALGDVLSDADALVVASVMQETYSILTREALARGVPVVTTACLGPEEVVTDRVNGLVVPQDDPEALASAMAELAGDRTVLHKLARAARGVELTPVTAHCDRLEQLYAESLAHPVAHQREDSGRVRRVLFAVGIDGAPLRYRAHLPAEALGLLGVHADVRHYRHPDVVELAARADVVVLYRVPATHQVRELVDDLHRRRTPVVFDVDDLIFDPALEPEIPALEILTGDERSLWLQGVHRYRTTMEMCDAFVGSTQRLCDHAFEVTGLPSFRFPNGAGVVMSRLADRALRKGAAPGALRVGYLSGTDTHDHDWAMIEQAVVSAVAKVPDAELWLVGKLTPGDPARSLGERLRIVPFQPWTSLPALLAALDVNLAPLAPNSRFNDAKSAIKWLEAALSATPTIASPTQAFEEVVEHGVNGMLAACAEEWADAVATLLGDDALRHRLGARARRDALLRFGPWTQARRYLEILGSVERRTSYESTWRPVLLDEPYEPVALEPYGGCEPDDSSPPAPAPASASASAAEPLAAKLGALARRGAASVRRRGLLQSALVALGRLGGRIRRP